MPSYEHLCNLCAHEWEDIYKMSDPVPDTCPKCKEKNCVKRLISIPVGRVELTGHERIASLKEEGKKMANEMKRNENKLANFIGESAYNKKQ